MSWSNRSAVLVLCLVFWHSVQAATDQVCPGSPNHFLRYVDVFDGDPSDRATLEPDLAKKTYGFWLLDYVYKEGRFVTIRCKYSDKQTLDIKLTKPVNRCDYKVSLKKVLDVSCR
jgi:hypothetical protein